jgi:diacylglycerol kinase family enzyme
MLFVVNPASARGRTLELWNSFRGSLARFGLSDKCHITSRPGEAVEVTRDALMEAEEPCIVGGDGTLNEILNGYLINRGPLVHNARLGVLPLGTGADFSRSLGIPSGAASLEAAGRMLVRGRSGKSMQLR